MITNKIYDEIFQSFLIDITFIQKITIYLINKKVGIISVKTRAAVSDAPFTALLILSIHIYVINDILNIYIYMYINVRVYRHARSSFRARLDSKT